MSGVYPYVSKTAKVAPIFEKDSKLGYGKYRPISLSSNIERILEKLMYKNYIHFLITIMLSITCSLDSDIIILHLTP